MKRILIALSVIVVIIILLLIPATEQRELTQEELNALTAQRKKAYDFAVECSKTQTPALKFEDITWVIIPGNKLTYNAIDGTVNLLGYFSPTDSIIYMPYAEYNTNWIMVHESLHAIGYIGHPRTPFMFPCRATIDQNP